MVGSYNSSHNNTEHYGSYDCRDLPRSTWQPLEQFIDLANANQADDEIIDKPAELRALNEQHRLVREFARSEINDCAYVAAALGVIYDQVRTPDGMVDSTKARGILRDYFNKNKFSDDPDEDYRHKIYIAGLLGDRTRINNLRAASAANTYSNINSNTEIPAETWLSIAPMAKPDVLRQTAESVNIESLLIASAESLQRLNTTYGNDISTLHEIAFVEQTLEPMAEMIGFDSLAMALSSRTKEIRLTNAGRTDLLHRADTILKCVDRYDSDCSRRSSVEQLVGRTLNTAFGTPNAFEASASVENSGVNEAVFGTIYDMNRRSDISEGSDGTVGRFRLKTRGSLAWKLLHDEKVETEEVADDLQIQEAPMDLIGLTLICHDEEEQSRVFAELVNGIYSTRAIQPQIANSKLSPVHIAGMPDYIDRMMAGLDSKRELGWRGLYNTATNQYGEEFQLPFVIDAKPAATSDGLCLAKVTYMYAGVPVEVQVVTESERHQMRCGKKAHIIYKAKNAGGNVSETDIDKLVAILPDIHARRRRISTSKLVGSHIKADGTVEIGASEHEARERLNDLLHPGREMAPLVGMVTASALADRG